ncbi:MAG: hypothetical protein RLZZ165_577 [Bacteroidota bacterium]|jgi:Ni,Fe-hydrogenase I cytochrome b subunit
MEGHHFASWIEIGYICSQREIIKTTMEIWRKILSYIALKKQAAPTEGSNGFNLRAMHTINKISILMFLVGMAVLVVKLFLRSH